VHPLPHPSYVTALNLLVPIHSMNVSSPDRVVSNMRTIRRRGVEGDKGWDSELIWGAIPAFTWRDWKKRLRTSVMIDQTCTRHLPNTKQGCHTLRQRSAVSKMPPIRNPLMNSLGVVVNHYFRCDFKRTEYSTSLRYTLSLPTLNSKQKRGVVRDLRFS
jgi:hypothetical protein